MAEGNFAIYDSATGAVLRTIIGDSALAAANTGAGEAYLDVGISLASSKRKYVSDPGSTPALSARPENTAGIPEIVTAGDDIDIVNVPDGSTVTVTLVFGSGTPIHSGAKSGGLGTYSASPTGAGSGDLLLVEVSGFPYVTVRGYVEVV